ncbi:P-loop containing nucleoside triphosphate hydrolase protein [Favolaschia claudopus]|uniref:P-loop containing nucleoside triphosphate hydrolase protein n=1 Tax=Favolaschia claudopus TaxID=2862362 RepID=A0AAW0AWZ1_9AGAR
MEAAPHIFAHPWATPSRDHYHHQQILNWNAVGGGGDASAHLYASPPSTSSPSFTSTMTLILEASPDIQPYLLSAAFLAMFAALTHRTLANRRAPRYLEKKLDYLMFLKAVFSLVYLGVTATMLVLAPKDVEVQVLLGFAVAAAFIFPLASLSEHYHSLAPSATTSLCALISTAIYAYPLRLLSTTPAYLHANTLATLSLSLLVILESKSKRTLLVPMNPAPAYESTLSFLVKPFFPHLLPLLYRGSKRRITLPELKEIPLHLQADPATEKLLVALAGEERKGGRYLLKSTFRAFRADFLSPVFPRVVVLVASFAQVTLVEQMIKYVSDKNVPADRGAWLVGGYFVVYASLAIANYVFTEKVNAFIVLYRSALTGSLYHKTLLLTSMAAREVGQGAATTYMSVDVDKVTLGFQTFQELWAAVVTLLLACIMLYLKAGLAMLAPLLFIVVLLGTTSGISRIVGAAQRGWLEATDGRVRVLTSVLSQLLPIKLGAYSPALAAKITQLREVEARALGRFISTIAAAASLSNIGANASALVTLAAYAVMRAYGVGGLEPLDVSRVFTLVTIVDLLNGPLNIIGQTLPQLFASFASIERIQTFLQLPEKAEMSQPGAQERGIRVETEVLVDIDGSSTFASAATSTLNGDLSSSAGKESDVEVSMKGCTFTWDEKAAAPVLRDVTLEVVPGELHMVVGSVASGKSSLLMSILEETKLVEGKANIRARKIALASQTAFIYPATLRANILLDSPFDEAFYDQVIHACGLRQDIEALPRRDMTKLGDKGSNLSGGQRQRVALARAVYARADLILLDDVFSALDGETEGHVFESLFGAEGMLKGKTTVLVTHGIHHLPNADKVIVMDAGTITHSGTFEEVRDAGAHFAMNTGNGEAEKAVVAAKEAVTAAAVVEDEEEEEELNWANEQTSRMAAYAFYIQCSGVVRTGILFAVIAAGSAAGIFVSAYPSLIAIAPSHQLGLYIAGYAGAVFVQLIFFVFVLQFFAYILAGSTAPRIHHAELEGVMGAPISWIAKNPVGKILNRFSQDIQVADREFPFSFLNFAFNILGIFGTFAFIAIATPWLVVALPFLAIIAIIFLRFYLATSKQFRRLESASKTPLYTLFGTTISGLITVRAYRSETFFKAQNATFVNESQGALHHRLGGQLFLKIFLLWFQAIIACGVAILTVALRGNTSAALLGLAVTRLVSLGTWLSHLLNAYAMMENGSVAIDRIEEFAKLPKEEEVNDTDLDMVVQNDAPWPTEGRLTFSDFSMKYREDLPLALSKISFDLRGGQKIGICGRTGSGKSSTVLSLFRGIDQHLVSGQILIDGLDISTISIKHLRESMSIVTQDPFLWHGSIRENLDVTNVHTDSEIWDTLKLVEMYDAVSALDDKLDHLIVDEESFSKGQRQLLCLARALLREKKIIVLDESTSSMDHITDGKIRHVVDTQMQGLTVVAIAHRISTIVNYDKILVLDRGTVAEFDDPKALLANPESRFARLAATQGIYHPDLVPKGAAVKEMGDGTVIVAEDLVDV